MATLRNKLLTLLVALALILACVPTVAAPIPTLDPGAVNTFIVQTANAASTQTAVALPSASPTEITPTPRNTATSSPTPTVTFVFILPSATSFVLPALTGISNGTSNSNYACQIKSVEPANGTVFAPRTDLVAKWGVKNIGKMEWFRASMDYVYVSGDKLHKVSSYDLPKGVGLGKKVILTVDMEAFKNKGTYTTTWALVTENKFFCPLTLTIVVN